MIGVAFTLGLVSSLHCLGMCAPLQAVVMGQWLRSGKLYQALLYHGGRLATYALLGTAAALLGQWVGLPRWQGSFTIIAGLTLLLGYFGFKLLKWDRQFFALISPLLLRVQKRLRRRKGHAGLLALSGALNGLLPCGMVYAALLPAVTTGSVSLSALYMLAFGAGTLPLLLATHWVAGRLGSPLRQMGQHLIPLTVVLMSGLLILRGMELGIPFISPELAAGTQAGEACR